MRSLIAAVASLATLRSCGAFQSIPTRPNKVATRQPPTLTFSSSVETATSSNAATDSATERRRLQKESLLELLGNPTRKYTENSFDPVLADPETKQPVRVIASGPILGTSRGRGRKVTIRASPDSDLVYSGKTDTFYNLLEPISSTTSSSSETEGDETEGNGRSALPTIQRNARDALNSLRVFIPPPIRSALATAGAPMGSEYVPMRDLFTSPAVSFAYERGWRQNFAVAGFPGADEEYELARDFFEPAIVGNGATTVVDMSCATGLFTRRFAQSNDYSRVIGCDYSASMLSEARRRIRTNRQLNSPSQRTRLDLVRCDVGNIPMQTESLNAMHAGAAMHCWPDLKAATSEIYRVLKPGGRYFATTFLSDYFRTLQRAEGGATGPSRQAFQYFGSVDQIRGMMAEAGFEEEKVKIEILGQACVVIRCEK